VLDQISKFWIIQYLPQGTSPLISGIFHLTYTTNTGAAWSAFQGGVNWLKWLSLLVSLLLMYFACYGPKQKTYEQIGYGLILAGAMGNGIDRFLWGHVIDFLDFRLIRFPIFNIADVCINLGIASLLLGIFLEIRQREDLRGK
jgi:signal peptidase II